jgi:uncharacterized delta-60 repeat protein
MNFFYRLAVAAVSCLVHALALQGLSGDLHADALGAPVVVASPAFVTPTYGATVSLASDVLAAPPATYVWQRNGVSIIDGGRYSGATTGTLVITRANNTDNGAYTLTVTNDLGTASTTPASVTVVQTPFALDRSQPVTSASTTTSSSDYANVILHLPDGRTLLGGRGAFNGAAGTTASSGLIVIETDGHVTVPACGAFNGEIKAIYRQPDGKILVSGYFSQINGAGGPGRSGFARLNSNLTVDPDFLPQATSGGRHIFSDALGRVYIAGDFSIFQGDPAYQYLVRLKPDGSLDRSYRPQVDSGIRNIAFAPDGSVYLGGQLTSYGYPATPANGVVRLRPDGRIDPAFVCTLPDSLNITALAVQADGKLLVGSYSADAPLVRLFPDGTQDMSFDYDPATGSQTVAALAILPSGKILVGGSSATSANLLFRLDADGARDTTFDGGAGLAPPTGSYAVGNSIAPDPYGRLWIAGIHFTTYDGQPASRLAVLQGDSPVLAFTTQPAGLVRDLGASATFTAAATGDNGFTLRWHKNGVPLSDDGRISGATTPTLAIADLVASDTDDYTVVVTSPTTSLTSAAAKLIVRAAPLITWAPSDLAADFGAAATFTSQAFGAAPLAYRWLHGSTELTDGTVGGVTISGATTPELTITGLTFAQAGEYRLRATNALGTAVSDLARLSVTRRPGALAAGLGPIQPMPDGPVHAILRLADGSMLIAGDFTTIHSHGAWKNRGRIARFLADGTLDATFAPAFNDSISSLAQDNAGRIFVGGSFTAVTFGSTTTTTRRVARLTAALALDTAFDTTTGPDNSVEALAPTHDGGVYIGGFFTTVNGVPAHYVARLGATGSPDPAFTPPNTIGGVRSLLLRADGRLYVGGRSGTFLLSATGVRDTGFVPQTAGSSFPVQGMAMLLLPDNSLLLGGSSVSPTNYLRRLNATTGASLADYAANHAVNNHIGCLALQPDGKVLSGSFGVLKRTDPATGLDDTLEGGANIFAPFYFSAIRTIALDETGRIWVGGYFSTYNNESRPYLAILVGGEPGSHDCLLIPQTLTFTDIPDRILGANAAANTVTLAATSDQGLAPITYAVTSGSATISDTTLTITGAGDITVTATQAGDGTYAPATATQTFTVAPAAPPTQNQTISFATLAARTYGVAPFVLAATASSGLPVAFEVVSGPASLNGATLTLTGAGRVVLRATQPGAHPYKPALPVTRTITVNKAPLAVSFDSVSRLVRTPNPAFPPLYSGFVNGDTAADLAATRPVGKTTAILSSPEGKYPITVKGGLDANYRFVAGEPAFLTVKGFSGAYEALFVDASGTARGKLALLVPNNALTYTGTLNLVSLPAAIPVRGNLTASDGASAQASWSPAPATGITGLSLGFELTGDALDGQLSFTGASPATLSIAFGSRVFVQSVVSGKTQNAPWTGLHTLVLRDPAPLAESDLRAPPLGAGHASVSVAPTGVMTLKGKLADGTALTGTARPAFLAPESDDTDGLFRVFLRPYAKRLDSFLSGELTLVPHIDQTRFLDRYHVPETDGALAWAKGPSPANPLDTSYRLGFAAEVSAALDPWLPPAARAAIANGTAIPAGTLPQRLDLVSDPFGSAPLSLGHHPTGINLGQDVGDDFIPRVLSLNANSTVTVTEPVTQPVNATKFSLKIEPATGFFSGSYNVIGEEAGPLLTRSVVVRRIVFSGTFRQGPAGSDAPVAHAHFLFDPDLADSGPAANEQVSAELILTSGAPE